MGACEKKEADRRPCLKGLCGLSAMDVDLYSERLLTGLYNPGREARSAKGKACLPNCSN